MDNVVAITQEPMFIFEFPEVPGQQGRYINLRAYTGPDEGVGLKLAWGQHFEATVRGRVSGAGFKEVSVRGQSSPMLILVPTLSVLDASITSVSPEA